MCAIADSVNFLRTGNNLTMFQARFSLADLLFTVIMMAIVFAVLSGSLDIAGGFYPFLNSPGRILGIAFVVFILAIPLQRMRRGRQPACWLFGIAMLWVLYATLEWYCTWRQYRYRIELDLLHPIVFVLTVVSLLCALRGLVRKQTLCAKLTTGKGG